ncbi:MAG: hypothetical protein JNK11_00890 [Alphaproteobacteria bacterium]|nr:hypothetical protein [Alphaproteobacteria bacterium]
MIFRNPFSTPRGPGEREKPAAETESADLDDGLESDADRQPHPADAAQDAGEALREAASAERADPERLAKAAANAAAALNGNADEKYIPKKVTAAAMTADELNATQIVIRDELFQHFLPRFDDKPSICVAFALMTAAAKMMESHNGPEFAAIAMERTAGGVRSGLIQAQAALRIRLEERVEEQKRRLPPASYVALPPPTPGETISLPPPSSPAEAGSAKAEPQVIDVKAEEVKDAPDREKDDRRPVARRVNARALEKAEHAAKQREREALARSQALADKTPVAPPVPPPAPPTAQQERTPPVPPAPPQYAQPPSMPAQPGYGPAELPPSYRPNAYPAAAQATPPQPGWGPPQPYPQQPYQQPYPYQGQPQMPGYPPAPQAAAPQAPYAAPSSYGPQGYAAPPQHPGYPPPQPPAYPPQQSYGAQPGAAPPGMQHPGYGAPPQSFGPPPGFPVAPPAPSAPPRQAGGWTARPMGAPPPRFSAPPAQSPAPQEQPPGQTRTGPLGYAPIGPVPPAPPPPQARASGPVMGAGPFPGMMPPASPMQPPQIAARPSTDAFYDQTELAALAAMGLGDPGAGGQSDGMNGDPGAFGAGQPLPWDAQQQWAPGPGGGLSGPQLAGHSGAPPQPTKAGAPPPSGLPSGTPPAGRGLGGPVQQSPAAPTSMDMGTLERLQHDREVERMHRAESRPTGSSEVRPHAPEVPEGMAQMVDLNALEEQMKRQIAEKRAAALARTTGRFTNTGGA